MKKPTKQMTPDKAKRRPDAPYKPSPTKGKPVSKKQMYRHQGR